MITGDLPVLPERVRRLESSDGVTLATYDWGGDGPPLVMFHATGMHSHAYLPLLARLRDRFHCYGLDARSQGASTSPIGGDHTWEGIAHDVCTMLDAYELSGRGDVHAIGHSQGGFSALVGAHRRPGTFQHVFAFEPVVFSFDVEGAPLRTSPDSPNPMADAARRRRAVFASRDEAYDNYRAKPPFSLIDDDALRCYVQWGFADRPDGTVTLRCSPEHEAALFSNSPTDLFHHLAEIPCHVVLGLSEQTSPVFAAFVPMQAERLPHGELMRFAGRTHFGLLERIPEMADVITTAFGR